MEKCTSADKYEATRAPTCNGGDPCRACKKKWRDVQDKDRRRREEENTAAALIAALGGM
jgi:hypothetical protein